MIRKGGSAQKGGKGRQNRSPFRGGLRTPAGQSRAQSLHVGHEGGTEQGKRIDRKTPQQRVVTQVNSPVPLPRGGFSRSQSGWKRENSVLMTNRGGSRRRFKSPRAFHQAEFKLHRTPYSHRVPIRCQRPSPGRFVLVGSMRGSPASALRKPEGKWACSPHLRGHPPLKPCWSLSLGGSARLCKKSPFPLLS